MEEAGHFYTIRVVKGLRQVVKRRSAEWQVSPLTLKDCLYFRDRLHIRDGWYILHLFVIAPKVTDATSLMSLHFICFNGLYPLQGIKVGTFFVGFYMSFAWQSTKLLFLYTRSKVV